MAINIKPSRRGLLHNKMGIPQGEPIPTKTLTKTKIGAPPAEKKEIQFALNSRKWNHAKRPKRVTTDRGSFGFK